MEIRGQGAHDANFFRFRTCGLEVTETGSGGILGDILTYDLGHKGMDVVHDTRPRPSMGVVKVTFNGTVDHF